MTRDARRSFSRRELFAALVGRLPHERREPPRVPGVVRPERAFSLEDFYRGRRDGGREP
jgi:hypothetical protein